LGAIHDALTTGEPVASISKKFGISQSALYRYRVSSMGRVALEQSTAASASVTDFLTVLSESLRDADAVRRTALALGQSSTALRAAQTVNQLVGTLSTRLGIDSTSTANMLADADHLTDSLVRLIRDEPELAERLARALATDGHFELSGEFDDLARHLNSPALPKEIMK
jgi:hypothetical protein